VSVRLASRSPGSEDDDGKTGNTKKGYGERDSRIKRPIITCRWRASMAAISPRTIMMGGRQKAKAPRERCQLMRRAEMRAD